MQQARLEPRTSRSRVRGVNKLTTQPHIPPLSKSLQKRSLFWFNYLMAYSNSYFTLGICQASEKKLFSKNWSNHQQVMMMMFSTGQTDHSSGDGNVAYGCEWDSKGSRSIHVKTTVIQFTVLYKVILAFESLHKNLFKCDQWNKEPLYGYLHTLILLCVFRQIIGFSGKIITYQELFCTVMLLVRSAQPKQRRNKKVKIRCNLHSKWNAKPWPFKLIPL